MVSVLIVLEDGGLIRHARVAVGSCSPVAQRLPELEAHLVGLGPKAIEVLPQYLNPLTPIADVRGSAEYRLDAAADLCRRAIEMAATSE